MVLSYSSKLNLIALGIRLLSFIFGNKKKKNHSQTNDREATLEVQHFVEEKDSLTSGSAKGFILLFFFLFEPQSLFSSKHLMFFEVLGHAADVLHWLI